MHALAPRLPGRPALLVCALVCLVAAPIVAAPPDVTEPPALKLDCDGGPLDVGANIILDFGRSLDVALEVSGPGGPGFVNDPLARFGDSDISHVFLVGTATRRAAECHARPVLLFLGEEACLCLRRDASACDVDEPMSGGQGVPDPFECPTTRGIPCCASADDGLVLAGCRDLTAELGVVEVDLVVSYAASGAHRPHLYLGLLNLATGKAEHSWLPLRGDHGHAAPGRLAPPGHQTTGLEPDLPPGRLHPPGLRSPREPAIRDLPLSLSLAPGETYFLQVTLVEDGPGKLPTPPTGELGRGETETWLVEARALAGGGFELQLLAEGSIDPQSCTSGP